MLVVVAVVGLWKVVTEMAAWWWRWYLVMENGEVVVFVVAVVVVGFWYLVTDMIEWW